MRSCLFSTVFLIGTLVLCIASARSQSLSGIRIGDDRLSVAERIGFPPARASRSGPFSFAKWVLEDGNELSVTARISDGKIVYIESDWGGKQLGSDADFPGFYFGRTTLAEIEARLGSNGTVAFINHYFWPDETDRSVVGSNSYEVDTADPVIVTFITKLPWSTIKQKKGKFKTSETLNDFRVLYGIILSEPEYLFSISGPHQAPTPPRPKLSVDLLQRSMRDRRPEGKDGGATEAPPTSTTLGKVDEVELIDDHGTFLVPVHVNGKLILDFVLDSGASDVQIPDDVFRTLYRTNTVSKADFLGTETYVLADGSKAPSDRFLLHTLEVGNHTVKNVAASVGTVNSRPLLGQSFLTKLGSWTLDNSRHVLVLSDRVESR
jgi:predicted aspartyl protease